MASCSHKIVVLAYNIKIEKCYPILILQKRKIFVEHQYFQILYIYTILFNPPRIYQDRHWADFEIKEIVA